ncbi:MAG: 3-dehydroquinate synthase, partial [Chromatiales bacterium]|nr:3-dehydroquinate synthase [Chromatiales bacterium]
MTTDTQVGQSSTTSTHWQRFSVPFEYPVSFTRGAFDPGNTALLEVLSRLEPDKRHRCIVFIDDGLAEAMPDLPDRVVGYFAHHHDNLALVAAPLVVPGGEKVKNDLHFVENMQRHLYDYHVDRHAYVIGIGGGALLDAVGLVAATTHRGVRHVRIPSTVLSQNDSGIGVKNGVNLFDSKNFVGAFSPPFAVVNDAEMLSTLGRRDQVAGMAEAVKVALIRDAAFFTWLERNANGLALFEDDPVAYMVRRCAELHMHQIAHGGDPFETGSARPLDYGHWAAHKLESLTRHHLRHGEAVAIGIALDARYSVLAGHLAEGEDERIYFLLEHLGFKPWHAALETMESSGEHAVLKGLREFQEHLGGELTITLLNEIGVGVEVHEMDTDLILQ